MTDTKNTKNIMQSEWSYLFDVDTLEGGRKALSITPDEEARRKIALRLGILSVDDLKADLVISRKGGEIAYHVRGRMVADITQGCAVTLEPIKTRIEEEVEGWFADPEGAVTIAKLRHERESARGHGEMPVLEEKDDPEPLLNGHIDLGELVTQYLSLAINPYLQAEGVSFDVAQDSSQVEAAPDLVRNPFAALKDWKAKLTGEE